MVQYAVVIHGLRGHSAAAGGQDFCEMMVDSVTAVVFSQRVGSNVHVMTTVNAPAGMREIIRSIQMKEEIPLTAHEFRGHAVFLQGSNECLHVSFAHDAFSNRSFLRYRDRQYVTSRQTYNLLAGYCRPRRDL